MNGKRENQKVIEHAGHRVLISKSLVGEVPENAISHPNAKIIINRFEQVSRLKDYDLVVLPFSEFEIIDRQDRQTKDPYKDIFEKQLLEAVQNGTVFCFTHHNETVPGEFVGYSNSGYRYDGGAESCYETQAGFPWIAERKIRIGRVSSIILNAEVKRGEFGTFLNKWGASYNYFDTFGGGKFDDLLYSRQNFALGFAINWARGMMIYLPFQANRSNAQDLQEGLLCLIDSLLTYKTKRIRELPEWAKEPLFENETKLAAERRQLLRSIEAIDLQITPYEEAKSLLVANEHDLELAVPKFISSNLGILTEQEEKFAEDFWLLAAKAQKAAICEVKSVTKGFKKSAIYDVYNHREKYDLPETFPAVLFVNCNLQAGSWAKKNVPIQKDDYEIAVKNHVLIVRIEDLVQIWNLVATKAISADAVLKLLTTEVGWLECKDGKIVAHK